MGKKREVYVTFQSGNLKREDRLKEKCLDGRVIFRELVCDGVDLIQFSQEYNEVNIGTVSGTDRRKSRHLSDGVSNSQPRLESCTSRTKGQC
jgi:hypothetical protein